MIVRAKRCGRGLMLSASAAAIFALAAGSAAAQGECVAEIETLEQDIQAAEALLQSEEGQQQAMVQPDKRTEPSDQEQQATAPQGQPTEPGDQQQAAAPSQDGGDVRQQGMPQPDEMQAVRPPDGATQGQPGEMAGGAASGETGQPGAQAGMTGSVGAQEPEAEPRQPAETDAQGQQTAMAEQDTPTNHPLALRMADGSVVDMRPPEEKEEEGASAQAAEQPGGAQQQTAQQPASDGQQERSQQDEQAAAEAGEEAEEGAEPRQPAATHGPLPAELAWFGSEETVELVEASLEEARAALQQGNEQACLEAIQEARASIEELSDQEDGQATDEQPSRGGNAPR